MVDSALRSCSEHICKPLVANLCSIASTLSEGYDKQGEAPFSYPSLGVLGVLAMLPHVLPLECVAHTLHRFSFMSPVGGCQGLLLIGECIWVEYLHIQ